MFTSFSVRCRLNYPQRAASCIPGTGLLSFRRGAKLPMCIRVRMSKDCIRILAFNPAPACSPAQTRADAAGTPLARGKVSFGPEFQTQLLFSSNATTATIRRPNSSRRCQRLYSPDELGLSLLILDVGSLFAGPFFPPKERGRESG